MGKFFRINQYIKAEQVRVIWEDGKQLGVMPIGDALKVAKKNEVDLVEVAPNANPPVCKLINFKKFLYLEQKKQKSSKKGTKKGELKEIRISPFIAHNDLNIRLGKAIEFLNNGNKVKITVRFVGRQKGHKEFGNEIINKVLDKLSRVGKVEAEPKWSGNDYYVILNPLKS